jgi:hypothetical protein
MPFTVPEMPREHGADCGLMTYHTRFGDVVCDTCQTPIGWDWRLVRDGVFGDNTLSWARGRAEALRHDDPISLAVGDWYVTRNNLHLGAHPTRV